jgi:hypothetical protein
LDTLQGLASPLQRISPHQLLTLTVPRLPTWSRCPARISVSLHQSEGLVRGSAASFSHMEGDPPESHWGCALPGSRNPHRLHSQGGGTHYPMRLSGLSLLGLPKCCGKNVRPARTRLKPRWLEERKIYYTSGPAPGSLQKWHWRGNSGLWGFYFSECRSKQVGRTKADVAVSLSLGGYNVSH